jgi:GTP-binding protein HflX
VVAAFRATLEEINEADLILHVMDITHPNVRQQSETVMSTLASLGVVDQPVIAALNKIDRLPDLAAANGWLSEFPNSLAISAAQRIGLEVMLGRIEGELAAGLVYITVLVPYARGDLAALFHEQGTVVKQEHNRQGTVLEGYLPRRWLGQFRVYLV